MTDSACNYDELPYEYCAFPQAHPDRLAVVGALYGLSPAPVARCSVLELGCALGGNIIPMAAVLPESRFLGIDLSAGQIDQGRAVIEQLGLTNVELRAQDLMDFGDGEGPFDYVLCHGVYSWVPEAVQQHILSICRRVLAPGGLATISYNVHPGWRFKSAVRDILRYGARGGGGPAEQVARALEFLGFIARNVFDADSPYGRTVREAAEKLSKADPTYVFHEYLEECNSPCSFEEFVGRAESAGLRYVGDAALRDPSSLLTDESRAMLTGIADDLVRCEQTLDFLWHETFRRDVLCRGDVSVDRWPRPAALNDMLLIALAEPAAAKSPRPAGAEQFRSPQGRTLTTADPALKAALHILHAARPRSMVWADLLDGVRQAARQVDEAALARSLLACATASLVELHTHLPPIAGRPSGHPKASPVARWQAASGKVIVNLRHQCYELDGLSRAVLALLDGTRTRHALYDAIRSRLDSGELDLRPEPDGKGRTIAPAETPRTVDEILHALARLCLLMD